MVPVEQWIRSKWSSTLRKQTIFVPVVPVHHAALPLQQGGNFTITSVADVEKEAEAKKGITKLLLFHIAADLDLEAGTMWNISQAIQSRNGVRFDLP